MRRIENRKFSRKQGLAPGSLVDGATVKPTRIRHIRYSEALLEEKEYSTIEDLPDLSTPGVVNWVQVFGLEDSKSLLEAGNRFELHNLTLEDMQNTDRRLGFEDREDYLFFTLKRLVKHDKEEFANAETVALILKESLVVTFYPDDTGGYSDIVSRVKNRTGRIRKSGAPYLAYAIIDESIDTWLSYSEAIEDGLLEIEEDVLFNYRNELISQIHLWKKHLAWLRWMFRPYRDLNAWFHHDGSRWFPEDVQPYLTDVSDHVSRVIDTLELYRDMVEDLMTVNMTALSNRMNRVMKVLTIISTIFIPMTFLAGVYGMNFERMPELSWRWGYPAAIGSMLLVAGLMIGFFRKKKWL